MEIEIQFTGKSLAASKVAFTRGEGAVVEFLGIVRGTEGQTRISGLVYEIYQPMARSMICRIVEGLNVDHPCLAFSIVHRYGFVPVGEPSVLIRVHALHRTEAIRMLEDFLHRLKADVPIWKSAFAPC